MPAGKITIPELQARKGRSKFTMLTAYDAPMAQLVDEAGVDVILVGDSLGVVMLGYSGTAPVTMDEMIHHAKAVGGLDVLVAQNVRAGRLFFDTDAREAVRNAGPAILGRGVVQISAYADLLLGRIVRAIVDAGIAVIGHIGLTLQTAASLGGVGVQGGGSVAAARRILDDALAMQEAGCWAVLMEAVPAALAALITRRLSVPTIGIGAGPDCDGQVLVSHDLLGMYQNRTAKFVKQYADLGGAYTDAVRAYAQEVRDGRFPDDAHSY